jgi:F0F1-type ATP synthase membrane subunit b/b'
MKSMIAVLLATLALALGACQKPEDKRIGPAEQAGREIDKAAGKAGEKLEQAGEKLNKATEKLGEKVEQAGKEMQESARDARKDKN